MIITLGGFKEKSFVDKKDNRTVNYIELVCLISPEEHQDNKHIGFKTLTFNTTRNSITELGQGEQYEVVMSMPRLNKDGTYITKPMCLRPLS